MQRRRWVRSCFIVGLLLAGTACYGYRTTTLPRADAADRTLGSFARITTENGVVIPLANAKVEGDSVIGYSEISRERVAIAVSAVQKVETWSGSAGKSAAAAGVGGGVFLLAMLGLAALLLSVLVIE